MSFLFNRTSAILLAFTVGALVPQAHSASWLVRYLIMTMLFIVFLQTKFSKDSLHRSHGILFLANLGMGLFGFGAGYFFGGRNIALALFFAGITPTATAAAVIVSFLKGRVDYVVAAFLITNLGIALLMPLLLPFVLGEATPDVFGRVFGSILIVVFIPLGTAILLRIQYPPCIKWPMKLRNVSFGLWLSAMFLIMANASDFLRAQTNLPPSTLVTIGLGSLVVCGLNFAIGRWIGGADFGREASQALGQKNTAFTIYLAMTYASPLIALGPTFYVVWHNLWNSLQLHRAAKVQRSSTKTQ